MPTKTSAMMASYRNPYYFCAIGPKLSSRLLPNLVLAVAFFDAQRSGGSAPTPTPTSAHACYVYPADVRDPCSGKTCSFGARCVPSLDGLVARCQCPETCGNYGDSVGSTPVCGTDGRDYANTCELQKASCREMKEIGVKFDGKCGES